MVEKRLRKYIFPSMFAMIGTSCYVLADTFFISVAAGANGITALNLTLPVYAVIYAIGSMIGIGSATKYSLDKSLKKDGYENYFSNAVSWALLISVPFIFIGLLVPQSVLKLMGADETILITGLSYLRTVLLFAPAFMLNYTTLSFVRNDNNPAVAMAATLSSSIFNIIFDYVFMFPMKMGMLGAALATGIAPIISMAVCMLHYCSKKNTIRFIMQYPDIKKLFQACSLGVAGFVGEISSGVTTLSFNFILLKIAGNTGVAAYGVVANISLVGIAIFNGISQGLQPMASEACGTGNKDTQRRICRHSLHIGISVSLILVLVCWVFSNGVVSIFNSENSVKMADYAVTGLRIYSTGFLLAIVNIVRAGYFGAVGMAMECSVISLLRGIFAILFFVIVLSKVLGIYGVWLAFPSSELFTFIVSVFIEKQRKEVN